MRRKREQNCRAKSLKGQRTFFFLNYGGSLMADGLERYTCRVKEAAGLISRGQKRVNRLGKSEAAVTDFFFKE